MTTSGVDRSCEAPVEEVPENGELLEAGAEASFPWCSRLPDRGDPDLFSYMRSIDVSDEHGKASPLCNHEVDARNAFVAKRVADTCGIDVGTVLNGCMDAGVAITDESISALVRAWRGEKRKIPVATSLAIASKTVRNPPIVVQVVPDDIASLAALRGQWEVVAARDIRYGEELGRFSGFACLDHEASSERIYECLANDVEKNPNPVMTCEILTAFLSGQLRASRGTDFRYLFTHDFLRSRRPPRHFAGAAFCTEPVLRAQVAWVVATAGHFVVDRYVVALDPDAGLSLSTLGMGAPVCFINDCSGVEGAKPNCKIFSYWVKEDPVPRVSVRTTRAVDEGERLWMDYGWNANLVRDSHVAVQMAVDQFLIGYHLL